MDYILEKGDQLYNSLNVHTPLCIDELPRHVNIEGGNNITTDFLNVSYQETLNTGNGLIFFINLHICSYLEQTRIFLI